MHPPQHLGVVAIEKVAFESPLMKEANLYLARELMKLWNMEAMEIPMQIHVLGMIQKGFRKEIGGIGNQRKNRYHTVFNIVKISKNIPRIPGDLRRLAVTQT